MRKVWEWIKKRIYWIIGAIVFLFGIIFAVSYEKDKIDSMKHNYKGNKKLKEALELEKKVAKLEGEEQALKKAEKIIEEKIKDRETKMAQFELDAEGMTGDEVANYLNDHYYGSSSRRRK